MTEPYMKMAEIETKYPNQWVLINQPKTTKYQQVLGGHVIYHGQDQLALYEVVGTLPVGSHSGPGDPAVATVLAGDGGDAARCGAGRSGAGAGRSGARSRVSTVHFTPCKASARLI